MWSKNNDTEKQCTPIWWSVHWTKPYNFKLKCFVSISRIYITMVIKKFYCPLHHAICPARVSLEMPNGKFALFQQNRYWNLITLLGRFTALCISFLCEGVTKFISHMTETRKWCLINSNMSYCKDFLFALIGSLEMR